MITGSIIGDRELIKRLEGMPAAAKARIDATVVALGYELEARVKTTYLRGPRPGKLGVKTGRLLSSITHGAADSRSRFESSPTSSVYYVGTNVPYGAMWERGIRAHDVVAKNAKALHFMWHGQEFFRRRVHIPAQAPRPFLRPALDDLRAHIVERLQIALKTSMEQAVKR